MSSDPVTLALWARAVLRFAEAEGHDAEALLAEARLDRPALTDPYAVIPLERFYTLMERVADRTNDPLVGLRMGMALSEEDLGALAFVGVTHATVGEGLEAFVRHLPRGDRYALQVVGETAELRYLPYGPPRPAHWHGALFFVSDLVHNAARMTGLAREGFSVALRESDRARLGAIADQLATDVEGGALHDCVRFAATDLARPLPSASPAMRDFFEQFLDERAPPPAESFADRLAALIDARLRDEGALEAASLARALGCSVRTLQRRLHDDGLTLRGLVTTRRLERADTVLRAGGSISEAAFEAGYSEASALHRARREHE